MTESDTISIKRVAELDADMRRDELITVLEQLRFNKGHTVVRLDRDVRDYLVRLLRRVTRTFGIETGDARPHPH
jgi:hypothetical protein